MNNEAISFLLTNMFPLPILALCFRMIVASKKGKILVDMAIIIENATRPNRYDHFKVKCRRCGRELSYTRRDVLSHRRWPNGFIYCPVCKTPNGHKEDNLVESGETYETKEAVKKEEEKKKLAEQYTKGELENDIAKYSAQKVVFLPIGIVLMAISFTFIAISGAIAKQNPDIEKLLAILSTAVAPFVFAAGSVLFIIALVLIGKVRRRKELLEVKEREEKLESSGQ